MTARFLRPPLCHHVLRPHLSSSSLRHHLPRRPQQRTFFDLPNSSAPHRFSETRQLPHPPHALYALVADIDAYRTYLPFCVDSCVTRRDAANNSPTEADLRVGWGAFDETFRSRVRCDPEKLEVEADASQGAMFRRLVARWRLRPTAEGEGKDGAEAVGMGGGWQGREVIGGSEVTLAIEFAFVNPMYQAFSTGFAPKIAQMMVEAFEKRAAEMLGGKGGAR